eukprot:TRINITY_DN3045_c0_g1_i1.p1 TRINITY_DN3045_c0_g1~~TRINITY_DN3045_c0_g1_i1.p1  ORF type:complete len:646 (+),score=176.75 TRINITY_DN3045_c0_g1_i1:52-1989(+)
MFSALENTTSNEEQELLRKELHPESGVKVRIALVGIGAVAAVHHIPGIRIDPRASLVAICDPNEELLKKREKEWGPVKATTSYHEIANDPNVDAVIIATPNNTHVPIAIECLKNKKHVMCEKPLGVSASEAVKLQQEAELSGAVHMTALTYRFAPALRYIKHLVDEGKLGTLRHFRSQRFLDWPETSWSWRQYKETAGAGNIYDMTIHRIDFSQFLMGKIKSVSGQVKQFVPRDKTPDGQTCKPSEVDDWTAILVEFENGATGVFEGSTLMKGHHNNGLGFEWAEINGSLASVVYQLQDPCNILYGEHGKSLEKIPVPKEHLVISGSPRDPSVGEPGKVFRYDQLYEFVSAIIEKRAASPSFYDGTSAQLVADAALLSSTQRRWVDIEQLTSPTPKGQQLSGKVAVITGGGTGIGRGIALRYASAGAKVYILGRRPEPLNEVVEKYKSSGSNAGTIIPLVCDVSKSDDVTSTFNNILGLEAHVHILVNSAGTNIAARSSDVLTLEDYHTVMNANVDGAFYCIRAVLSNMQNQKDGLIINISSVAGLRGLPLAGAAYCASKAAMNALGSTVGAEQFGYNIRVTNICPGEVNTPIIDKRAVPDPPEKRALMLQPEDVAEAALMIASLPPRANISELVIKPTIQQFWL